MLVGMELDQGDLESTPSRGWPDDLAAVISTLADYGFIVAAVESLAVLRGRRTIREAAIRLGVVGLSVFGLNTALKRLVGRPRPQGASEPGIARTPRSASFPSGHTLAATTAAVAIPATPLGVAAGMSGAGLVGWSRLRLGAHHRSDVAGGLVIGIALGTLLRALLDSLDRSERSTPSRRHR